MKRSLARTALIGGSVGIPLWLLSYSWLPFALAGRDGQFVLHAVVVGEVGAFAAGALGVGLGFTARKRSAPGSREHRLASRSVTVASVVRTLVLIPNVLGRLLHAQ